MYDYANMKDRRVLITGGGSGIGRETALLLSRLGARVALLDLNAAALGETAALLEGEGHETAVCDLSEIGSIEPLLTALVKNGGAFDGFVHCAGIVKNLPLKNYTYERLHAIMRVNFYAFFEITRVLSRKGRFNPGMSVVGVSSVSANRGAPAQAAYAASKAAMNGAMRCLAQELGAEKGIRLNTVLPGMTNTPMYAAFADVRTQTDGVNGNSGSNPRRVLGMNEPSDVANAIVFLLSPASAKITGVELTVDGGFSAG